MSMDPPSSAASPSFPALVIIDTAKPHVFHKPTKCINDGPDVAHFLTSQAYRDIGVFVLQLNRAMCPRKLPPTPESSGKEVIKMWTRAQTTPGSVVDQLQRLLERITTFIEEAPPDPGPRRFGNVSFRTWFKLLEERAPALLEEFLPSEVTQFAAAEGGDSPTDELMSYFLGGFGSAQRLDYGTGHELSFVAFLGCLWKLGAFRDEAQGGPVERNIVLGVIEPYLHVIRKLILTYTLEPAGSHGVWGLDDHSFMPYIFGSAQLTRPITENEAMPLEGSVRGAPKVGDVVKPEVVDRHRETNMYFSAIGFINDVKKGAFWEHSPILFDISGIRDGWGKINKGMIKMFNAEVLSKFPVVQHFHFGSLFSWETDPKAAAPTQTVHMANQPTAAPGQVMPPPAAGGTAAPWAQATQMPRTTGPGIPYSRMPPPARGTPETARPAATRMPPPPSSSGSAESAQQTVTRAPWAKDS